MVDGVLKGLRQVTGADVAAPPQSPITTHHPHSLWPGKNLYFRLIVRAKFSQLPSSSDSVPVPVSVPVKRRLCVVVDGHCVCRRMMLSFHAIWFYRSRLELFTRGEDAENSGLGNHTAKYSLPCVGARIVKVPSRLISSSSQPSRPLPYKQLLG